MKIELDLDYDEAVALRARIKANMADLVVSAVAEDLVEALSNAIDNEDSRAYDRQQERLMEDGGVDDSAYRQSMKDAGRGHLLR